MGEGIFRFNEHRRITLARLREGRVRVPWPPSTAFYVFFLSAALRAQFLSRDRFAALGRMCLNVRMQAQDDPRFLKGIQEFNDGLFFECHETLEEIWLEDHGDDRKFYQGIIQIAAGYFKLEQGVPAGALKLWRMGLEKLAPYTPVHFGISVEALIQAVEGNLTELAAKEASDTTPAIQPPSIHFIC